MNVEADTDYKVVQKYALFQMAVDNIGSRRCNAVATQPAWAMTQSLLDGVTRQQRIKVAI